MKKDSDMEVIMEPESIKPKVFVPQTVISLSLDDPTILSSKLDFDLRSTFGLVTVLLAVTSSVCPTTEEVLHLMKKCLPEPCHHD